MTLYGAHLKTDAEPILLKEGFAWGALLFGPFWLALHRAWIAAALSLAAFILIAALTPAPLGPVLGAGLALLLGLIGQDLCGWSLEQRGYMLVHVVAARGREDALLRLLTHRPDLVERYGADALR
jgi:hypothetical protein